MKPIAIHPLSAALALTLALAACSTSQPTSELQLRDQDDYVSGEQTALTVWKACVDDHSPVPHSFCGRTRQK